MRPEKGRRAGAVPIRGVFYTYLKKFLAKLNFWKRKTMVGPYRLTGRIGSGGMADIYAAVHKNKNKKERVAIKLMKDEHTFDPVQRERFLHEGMIVDAIRHPNIVDIYHRGESDNHLFIVMELLKGRTLGRLIQRNGMMDIGLSLDVMRQVTSALVDIHKAGVVHRDLKPDNIMLVKNGKQGTVAKILDFGLAKTKDLPQITESGMVVGTICYLSPEQLNSNRYSTASDIYALGVIFFEMVTGVKPYPGETALEIMQNILKSEPAVPGAIRPGVPGKLDALILGMMAKEPAMRPATEELLLTLEKLLYLD
jgi:serine/threonine-protein kinase